MAIDKNTMAALITAAGWHNEFLANGDLRIWHSNGDDHADIDAAKDGDGDWFFGEWYDRDDAPYASFAFQATDAVKFVAKIVHVLQDEDPICQGCGSQGHDDGPECKG